MLPLSLLSLLGLQFMHASLSSATVFEDMKQIDIGNPQIEGRFALKNQEMKIFAGGADIWGQRDEFHFSYLAMKGDFDFTTRILSLSRANAYSKAGIMARAGLEADDAHVFFQVFPNNAPRNRNQGGFEFQYRKNKSGESAAIYPPEEGVADVYQIDFAATWIRLKRTGDQFEAYMSKDGEHWYCYTSFGQSMPQTLFLGLAVTSDDAGTLTEARFSSRIALNR